MFHVEHSGRSRSEMKLNFLNRLAWHAKIRRNLLHRFDAFATFSPTGDFWPELSRWRIKKAGLARRLPPSTWLPASQLSNSRHFSSIATPRRMPRPPLDF